MGRPALEGGPAWEEKDNERLLVAECRFGEVERELIDSAVETMDGWRFFRAQICRFPERVEPNDACEGEGVEIEPVPLRLT